MKIRNILVFFALAISLLGQTEYTLEMCKKIALEQNLELKKKAVDLKTYEDKVSQAYANLFPTISLQTGAGYILEPDKMSIIVPDTSYPAEYGIGMAIFMENPDFGFQHSLQIQQILFSAQAFQGVKLAKRQREVESLNRDILKRQVEADIENAFYSVLITEKVVEISEKSYSQSQEHFRIVQRKYEQGQVSEFEVIRTEVETKNSLSDLENAKLGNKMARMYLFFLMNEDFDSRAVFNGDFRGPIALPELDDALDTARENRMELKVMQSTLDVFKGLVNLQRATYLPSIVFQGMFDHYSGSDDFADYFAFDDFGKEYQLMLGLQWTLFNGFSRKNKVDEAKANHRKMLLQNEQVIAGIEMEIRQLHWQLKQHETDYRSALSSLEMAKKLLEIADVQYEEGMITFVEYQDAKLAHDATQLKYYQSLYKYNTALTNFLKGIGR